MPRRAAPAPLLVFDQEVAYPGKVRPGVGKRARRIRWVQPSAAQLPNGWEHPLTRSWFATTIGSGSGSA